MHSKLGSSNFEFFDNVSFSLGKSDSSLSVFFVISLGVFGNSFLNLSGVFSDFSVNFGEKSFHGINLGSLQHFGNSAEL